MNSGRSTTLRRGSTLIAAVILALAGCSGAAEDASPEPAESAMPSHAESDEMDSELDNGESDMSATEPAAPGAESAMPPQLEREADTGPLDDISVELGPEFDRQPGESSYFISYLEPSTGTQFDISYLPSTPGDMEAYEAALAAYYPNADVSGAEPVTISGVTTDGFLITDQTTEIVALSYLYVGSDGSAIEFVLSAPETDSDNLTTQWHEIAATIEVPAHNS